MKLDEYITRTSIHRMVNAGLNQVFSCCPENPGSIIDEFVSGMKMFATGRYSECKSSHESVVQKSPQHTDTAVREKMGAASHDTLALDTRATSQDPAPTNKTEESQKADFHNQQQELKVCVALLERLGSTLQDQGKAINHFKTLIQTFMKQLERYHFGSSLCFEFQLEPVLSDSKDHYHVATVVITNMGRRI